MPDRSRDSSILYAAAAIFPRQIYGKERAPMLDTILLIGGTLFFVLAVLYVYACDRM